MKLLTNNIQFLQDSKFFNFATGYQSGIIKTLNDFRVTAATSNTIAIDTGVLVCFGVRIANDDIYTHSFNGTPTTTERMSLIFRLTLADGEFGYEIYTAPATQVLTKQNIYDEDAGAYELELAKFTLSPLGITDVVQTVDELIKDTQQDYIIIGNVETIELDAGMKAEVDIQNREDAETGLIYTDFTISIPKPDSAGTKVSVAGVEKDALEFTSDPQAQITTALENAKRTARVVVAHADYGGTEDNCDVLIPSGSTTADTYIEQAILKCNDAGGGTVVLNTPECVTSSRIRVTTDNGVTNNIEIVGNGCVLKINSSRAFFIAPASKNRIKISGFNIQINSSYDTAGAFMLYGTDVPTPEDAGTFVVENCTCENIHANALTSQLLALYYYRGDDTNYFKTIVSNCDNSLPIYYYTAAAWSHIFIDGVAEYTMFNGSSSSTYSLTAAQLLMLQDADELEITTNSNGGYSTAVFNLNAYGVKSGILAKTAALASATTLSGYVVVNVVDMRVEASGYINTIKLRKYARNN